MLTDKKIIASGNSGDYSYIASRYRGLTHVPLFKHFTDADTATKIVELKRNHKSKHFEWDPFLKDFFVTILENTEQRLET